MANHRAFSWVPMLAWVIVAQCVFGGREAWGIVGGGPPDPRDTRFDCVGAFTKSDFPPSNTFGSCTLIAPNLIITARHNLNYCQGACGSCPACCFNDDPGSSPGFLVRFRRLVDGTLGIPGTIQHDVPVVQFILPQAHPNCGQDDYVLGVLAWPVTHIQPAVIDYSDVFDPLDGNLLGYLNNYGEFFIAGWGFDDSGLRPGTLHVATMHGRPSSFGKFPHAAPHDSGGAVLAPASCGRMRLVGTISFSYSATPCRVIRPDIRAHIPAPPPCPCGISSTELPDPVVAGQVTATAIIVAPGLTPDQHFVAIPSSGWFSCGLGDSRCANGISQGTSAGSSANSTNAGQCWYAASASGQGNAGFDLSVNDRVWLEYNVSATHQSSLYRVSGGGSDPNSIVADSAFGCPANANPFEITVPFTVTGTGDIVLRIATSGAIEIDFGPSPPDEISQAIVDVRSSWDLFADIDDNGFLSPLDIQVGHAEVQAVEWPQIMGLQLINVSVTPGVYLLRTKCIVDNHVRASVKDCDQQSSSGEPAVDTRLRVEVFADSY